MELLGTKQNRYLCRDQSSRPKRQTLEADDREVAGLGVGAWGRRQPHVRVFVTVLPANSCASSTVHSRTKRNPAGRSLSCINRIESVHCGEFSETEHSIPFMCARRRCIAKKMSKTPSKSHRLAEHATSNQYEESKGGNCFLLSEPIDHFLHTKAPTAAALSSGCLPRLMDTSQQEFVSCYFGLKAIEG